MANETVQLAEYAASLRYEDLPPEVVACARDAIIDTAGGGDPGQRAAVEPHRHRLCRAHRPRRQEPHSRPGRSRCRRRRRRSPMARWRMPSSSTA